MLSKHSLTLIIIVTFVSCSGLVESTRKTLLGDDTPRQSQKKEAKWVSKDQYDDLLIKYKNLNDKYEKLKEDKYASGTPQVDQAAELSAGNPETVDVFGKDGIVNSTPQKAASVDATTVEEELDYYKKAVALKDNNKNEEALKMFQFLEKSNSRQISVRAKRNIGDLYLAGEQFDLALQVYEGIIRKDSFSGSTLKALEKAAICAGKLGLTDKKAQYESLLRDVFESQV